MSPFNLQRLWTLCTQKPRLKQRLATPSIIYKHITQTTFSWSAQLETNLSRPTLKLSISCLQVNHKSSHAVNCDFSLKLQPQTHIRNRAVGPFYEIASIGVLHRIMSLTLRPSDSHFHALSSQVPALTNTCIALPNAQHNSNCACKLFHTHIFFGRSQNIQNK